ncbi:hypothetical protein DIPPA_12575 [Diplonema papillatum]|nr:hypothetical protein DIPPA_12575 [Diplonema papillatum]
MSEQSRWFLLVVTDSGKKYSLEVKGDINTVTAAMLKPKLAESSGVPVSKQVLSFKGRELSDNIPFDKLGIQPDDELHLSKRATETQYYKDVVSDSITAFDKEVAANGGENELMGLPDEIKEKILKELSRRVKGMKKNLSVLQDEIGYAQGDARKELDVQFARLKSQVNLRETTLNYIVTGGAARAPVGADSLCRASPELSEAMQYFYRRIHVIYLELEHSQLQSEATSIAGRLVKIAVDLKILWHDVLNSQLKTPSELSIMRYVTTDCRMLLVRTLTKYLDSPVGQQISRAEVLATLQEPAARLLQQLPKNEDSIAEILRGAARDDVDEGRILKLLFATAGVRRSVDGKTVPNYSPMSVSSSASSPSMPQKVSIATPVTAPSSAVSASAPKGSQQPSFNPQVTSSSSAPVENEVHSKAALAARADVVDALHKGNLWHARLLLFYIRYNPGNLPAVPRILTEYQDNEEKLFSQLFEKYRLGDDVRDSLQAELTELCQSHNIALQAPKATSPQAEDGCMVM